MQASQTLREYFPLHSQCCCPAVKSNLRCSVPSEPSLSSPLPGAAALVCCALQLLQTPPCCLVDSRCFVPPFVFADNLAWSEDRKSHLRLSVVCFPRRQLAYRGRGWRELDFVSTSSPLALRFGRRMSDPPLPLDCSSDNSPLKPLRLSDLGFLSSPSTRQPVATPQDAALSAFSPAPRDEQGPLLDSALPLPPPSLPDAPVMMGFLSMETPTPSKELQRDLTLPAAVHSSLPPDMPSSTGPSIPKHSLRLPSFEALGIAVPHPDRKVSGVAEIPLIGAGPLSNPEDPLHILSPQIENAHRPSLSLRPKDAPTSSPDSSRRQIKHFVATFTPPEESGSSSWASALANVTTAALDSPAQSDPERTTPGIAEAMNSETGTPSTTMPLPGPLAAPQPAEAWPEAAIDELRKFFE